MKYKFLLASIATASLVACGGGNSNNGSAAGPVSSSDTRVSQTTEPGQVCGGGVGTQSGLDIKMADDSFKPLCDINQRITQDATLTLDNVYRLNGYIHIGSGDGQLKDQAGDMDPSAFKQQVQADGVTLTVNAGVHFRSSGRGSLIVTRGSQLVANGTAINPIVMSSLDSDFAGQGEWGGLVVQGFAKNNKCGEGSRDILCDTADEAGTGFHGGNADADSSGTIRYLIVAEGGFEIAPDSEVNGITLHSVGYGTLIEHVMVYNNADDGIEFFGGAANVKNLILVDNGDESIDWDDGYRGNIQFGLVRQGLVNEGDHGIEADNKGRATNATPLSKPTLTNITFEENSQGADDLFRFKEGTGGDLTKIAAKGYQECLLIEEADTGANGSLVLEDNLFDCQPYPETDDSNKFIKASDGGLESNVDGDTIVASNVELGNAFEVTGGNGSTDSSTATSANDSANFFEATDYIGAIAPTVTAAESAWWSWAAEVVPAAFEK